MQKIYTYRQLPSPWGNVVERFKAARNPSAVALGFISIAHALLRRVGIRALECVELDGEIAVEVGSFRVRTIDELYTIAADYQQREMALLRELAKDLGGEAVDGGAYIGGHSVAMKNAFVYSFEPHPQLFPRLRENLERNRVRGKAYRAALGNVAEMAFQPCSSSISSKGRGEKVESVALDTLPLEELTLLKLDVEGAEKEVLESGLRTLKSFKPIIMIEVIETPWEGLLERLGYRKLYILNHLTAITAPRERESHLEAVLESLGS